MLQLLRHSALAHPSWRPSCGRLMIIVLLLPLLFHISCSELLFVLFGYFFPFRALGYSISFSIRGPYYAFCPTSRNFHPLSFPYQDIFIPFSFLFRFLYLFYFLRAFLFLFAFSYELFIHLPCIFSFAGIFSFSPFHEDHSSNSIQHQILHCIPASKCLHPSLFIRIYPAPSVVGIIISTVIICCSSSRTLLPPLEEKEVEEEKLEGWRWRRWRRRWRGRKR